MSKISIKSVLIKHLRTLPHGKHLTVSEADTAADKMVAEMVKQITVDSGELIIGNIGKIFSKAYPAVTRYNPFAKKHELRPAYKTVRFKAFKNARTAL